MKNERVDVIALQETHVANDKDLKKRRFILDYLLIGSIHHTKYSNVREGRYG